MAEKKEPGLGDAQTLIAALQALSPDQLRAVLLQSGTAPTTIGMTTDQMQMLIGSLNPAIAMREAYRLQRKENPNYPEMSVFNPRGRFDHEGVPQRPKATFRRETFFMGVRLGGELETETEIDLCNRFTEDRSTREGRWTAIITQKGTAAERLTLTIPSKTQDDRMENAYPFPVILKELLEGAAAVNQETMVKRITDLEAQIKALSAGTTDAAA